MKSIREMLNEEDAFPICDLGTIGAAIINSTFGCLMVFLTPIIGVCTALPTVMIPVMLQGK